MMNYIRATEYFAGTLCFMYVEPILPLYLSYRFLDMFNGHIMLQYTRRWVDTDDVDNNPSMETSIISTEPLIVYTGISV